MQPRTFLLAVGLLLSACGDRSPAPPEPRPSPPPTSPPTGDAAWKELPAEGLSSSHAAQVARAVAARDALGSRLLGRLKAVLDGQGPAAAVGVCRGEAPAIATDVAREQGVRIGRTSHRLRSLMNGVPAWADVLVATRRETPALLAAPDGRLGALYPIRTQALCITCHGAPEALAPDVRAAIAKDYPADRATGFAEGDLRGWFWVEVPAP